MSTIPATFASAAVPGLVDTQKLALDRLVRPLIQPEHADEDPLRAVLLATAALAREAGLTDDDVDAELAAYNAERRA